MRMPRLRSLMRFSVRRFKRVNPPFYPRLIFAEDVPRPPKSRVCPLAQLRRIRHSEREKARVSEPVKHGSDPLPIFLETMRIAEKTQQMVTADRHRQARAAARRLEADPLRLTAGQPIPLFFPSLQIGPVMLQLKIKSLTRLPGLQFFDPQTDIRDDFGVRNHQNVLHFHQNATCILCRFREIEPFQQRCC